MPELKSNSKVRVLHTENRITIYERTRTRARYHGHVYMCKRTTGLRVRMTSARRIKDSKPFYERFTLLGYSGRYMAYKLGVPSWAWKYGKTRGAVAVRNWATGRLRKHHYQSVAETGMLDYWLLGDNARISWVSTYYRFNPYDPSGRAVRAVQIWKSDNSTPRGTMKKPSFAEKLDDAEAIDPLSLNWAILETGKIDFKTIRWRSAHEWKEAKLR